MPIMQEHNNSYTAYARSLCPSWCTETHEEQADPADVYAVRHLGPVGEVTVTDSFGNSEQVDVRVGSYNSLSGSSDNGLAKVTLWTDVPTEMSPEDATRVALLLIRAAEVARRG